MPPVRISALTKKSTTTPGWGGRAFLSCQRDSPGCAAACRHALVGRRAPPALCYPFAMPPVRISFFLFQKEQPPDKVAVPFGAGNEIRTRYLHLGKVALCQMSYARVFLTAWAIITKRGGLSREKPPLFLHHASSSRMKMGITLGSEVGRTTTSNLGRLLSMLLSLPKP